MIPVIMTQKEVYVGSFARQFVSHRFDPRAGIQYEIGAVIEFNVDTSRVTTVFDKIDTWNRYGATYSVECKFHTILNNLSNMIAISRLPGVGARLWLS